MRARAVPAESNVADLSGSRSFGVGPATGPSQEKSRRCSDPSARPQNRQERPGMQHTIDGMPMPQRARRFPKRKILAIELLIP